ncbi:hypothetical protein QYE76_002346 [Lolium multiflorum]|uniref:RNase H type-1 domain-containing protein n=1 Tax=Lolium multiflorum TaxID=4521 RepID=A0AAD8RQF0_LOLMU|nr:hypothetical protein QYE76_002346 [Lolium multiflorum]
MGAGAGVVLTSPQGDKMKYVMQMNFLLSTRMCDAVSDNMVTYREMYCLMEGKFEGCKLKHISRANNEEADTLANIRSTCSAILDGVFYEVITQQSIKVNLRFRTESSTKQPATTSSSAQFSKFCSSSQFEISLSLHICCVRNYPKTQQRHDTSSPDPKHTQW